MLDHLSMGRPSRVSAPWNCAVRVTFESWAVGSRFGYFPKDLLEINHIYTEKEREIPTEDTDFVCFDGGPDHFDSYDVDKLLESVHLKDKSEVVESEIPDSVKEEKNENDDNRSKEENLLHGEKEETRVHENDQNENEDKKSKEENLLVGKKEETNIHKKDESENEQKQNKEEELAVSEEEDPVVHGNDKNDEKQNKEQELADSEKVETAVHENDEKHNKEELPDGEKVETVVHEKDKNENGVKQTKEERLPLSEKEERTVHKTDKDQNDNLELDNEEKVLEDSDVSETSEDEKATDVELSTSSKQENETESSGEPQRDSGASVSNGNENINDATLSQKEDLTKTVDGAELKEAEAKTLQEEPNNTLRSKLEFTFDAVVSNDENTRKVTPLYEGADEEENELEATTEGFVEPSKVTPLLPYSKDKEEPERESKDEEPAHSLENDEEQTKQDQSHKLDKQAEKHENTDSPEKAKSMWTTFGDTVFAIVSGGETTRKVSTIDEDDEEEEEEEEEEKKNEEPKKDIVYFLDSDSPNAKEEVDLASQDFEETVNVSIDHGHQQSENLENADGRHELDPKSKSEVSVNETSEVKEHQQNKEDEPAPLTEDASNKLKNTEANTSGAHLVSEGGEQPKNIVDSDWENEEIHSDEDPEMEANPSSTNQTRNEIANTEVEGSENSEDVKTEDESSPSEDQNTETKTQKTKDKEDEELSSEERYDDFTNELAKESEVNTTDKKEVDEEKEETQEEHETLSSDEETDLEEETLLEDENAVAADVDNKGVENNGETSDNRDIDIDTHDLDDDQNSTKTTAEEEDDEQDLGDELTKSAPLQEKEMKVKAEDDEGKDEADKRTESPEEEEEEGGINIKDPDENTILDESANATTSSKAPKEEHSEVNYSESIRELTILKTHFGEKQLQLFYKYLDVHDVFKVEAMFHDLEEELKLARQTSRNTEEIEKSLDDILESSEVSILDQIEKMLDKRETKNEELQQMDKDMADAEASMLEDFQELAFQLRQKYSAASDSTPLAPGVHHHESITDVKSKIPDNGLETEKDENKEFEMNVVDENNEALNSSPVTESPAVLAENDQNDGTTQSWTSTLIDILRAIKKYTVRYFEMFREVGIALQNRAVMESGSDGASVAGEAAVFTSVYYALVQSAVRLVNALPEDWQPGATCYGLPWEPVVTTVLVGFISFMIFFWRTVLAIKICEQQIADSEKTKSSDSVENEELKISETKAHIDKLQKTIHSTTAELSKAKTRAKEAKHKEETLMAELDVLVQENNKLKQNKNKQLENIKGWEERYKELSEQIKGFQKTQKELEEKLAHKDNEIELIKKLEHDHSSLTIEKNRLENDFKTIQQKLEIMNELYQQKENALQQKLSQEEFERREKEQKLSEVDGKALQAEEQLKIYKMRIQEIEEELQKTERSYKNQIAVHEKKAHENWLNARAAERALVEEKRETSNLRQKLVEVNDKFAALQRPGLIKPTPGRPDRQIPPLRRGTLSHDDSFGPSPVCDGGPSPPLMIEGPGRPPSAPVARREPFDAGVSTHPLNASGPRTSSPNAPQEGSVNSKGQGPPSFPGTPISSPSSGMGLPVRGYAPPPPAGSFPHLNGPNPQMLIGPPNGVPPVPGARFGSLPPSKGPFGLNPYGPALPHNVRGPPPLLRDYPPGPLPPPPAPPLPHFGPRDFVPSLKEHPSGFTPTYAARDFPFPPKGMAPPYIPAPAQVGPRDFQPGPLPQSHGIPGLTPVVQQTEPKDSSA
ncbi:TGO1 protein, partial [Polypterus senegalus]